MIKKNRISLIFSKSDLFGYEAAKYGSFSISVCTHKIISFNVFRLNQIIGFQYTKTTFRARMDAIN